LVVDCRHLLDVFIVTDITKQQSVIQNVFVRGRMFAIFGERREAVAKAPKTLRSTSRGMDLGMPWGEHHLRGVKNPCQSHSCQ